MKIHYLEKDIHVLCITAKSFPNGVMAAHQQLHSLFPPDDKRQFFGISHETSTGEIIYKAAAEIKHDGEAAKYNCEAFVIRKGSYLGEILKNWQKGEMMVAKTFQKMIKDPRVDHQGYCLEIYLNDNDMQCLVPIDASKINQP